MATREDVVLFDCGLAQWYESDWRASPPSLTALHAVHAANGDSQFAQFVLPACGFIGGGAQAATGLTLSSGGGRLYLRGWSVPALPEAEVLEMFADFLKQLGAKKRRLTLVAHNEPSILSLSNAIYRAGLYHKFRGLVVRLQTAAPDVRYLMNFGPLEWEGMDINQGSLRELGRAFNKRERQGEFLTAYRLRVLQHVIYKLNMDYFNMGQQIDF